MTPEKGGLKIHEIAESVDLVMLYRCAQGLNNLLVHPKHHDFSLGGLVLMAVASTS